ncbi:MAG: 50S ribosomal protein L3 [Gemmatimonadota bacterium]
MAGLIGQKVGMTQIFDEAGNAVPVTVIAAGPCPVVQLKSEETDGYRAIQLGFGAMKEARATKAASGHAAKAGVETTPRILREFEVGEDESYEPGQQLTVEQFAVGDAVKVTGKSKGRGFQGVVKRYGFAGRPASHGHPMSRNPGSLGPGTDPSRVIKGKKMPGRMGNARVSLVNQKVVKVDPERNLLFIKGGVPGSRNSYVFITK